jgi:hypothetical protein
VPDALVVIAERVMRSLNRPNSPYFNQNIDGIEDLPMFRARIGFRDICRSNDSRTMIACLLPPGVTAIETAPCLLRRSGNEQDESFLLGVMTSIPFDWYARRVVELHMTLEVIDSMPIPLADADDVRRKRVTQIAGTLAARDARYSEWASQVDVPVGSIHSPVEQTELESEIDANVASLYGISRDQLEHVFLTFHRGWDYRPRLDKVLTYFDQIEAK